LRSAKEPKPDKSLEVFEEIEKKEKTGRKEEKQGAFDYKSDNQLMRAVDILKAIKIFHGKGE